MRISGGHHLLLCLLCKHLELGLRLAESLGVDGVGGKCLCVCFIELGTVDRYTGFLVAEELADELKTEINTGQIALLGGVGHDDLLETAEEVFFIDIGLLVLGESHVLGEQT